MSQSRLHTETNDIDPRIIWSINRYRRINCSAPSTRARLANILSSALRSSYRCLHLNLLPDVSHFATYFKSCHLAYTEYTLFYPTLCFLTFSSGVLFSFFSCVRVTCAPDHKFKTHCVCKFPIASRRLCFLRN